MASAETHLGLFREAWRTFKEQGTLRFLLKWLNFLAEELESTDPVYVSPEDADKIRNDEGFQSMIKEIRQLEPHRYELLSEVETLLMGRVTRAFATALGYSTSPSKGHRTTAKAHKHDPQHIGGRFYHFGANENARKRGVDAATRFMP